MPVSAFDRMCMSSVGCGDVRKVFYVVNSCKGTTVPPVHIAHLLHSLESFLVYINCKSGSMLGVQVPVSIVLFDRRIFSR